MEAAVNPYRAADDGITAPPFAGRQQAIARLYQQLADISSAEAMIYTGRHGIGKTTLLRYLESTMDEIYLGVYVPLADTPLPNELEWILALAQGATASIIDHGLGLGRLSEIEPPGDDARAWLIEKFLPEVMVIIRPHRKLVFLLDDAHFLLGAVANAQLPADTFRFLHDLLTQFDQAHIALTLDAERENDLLRMSPLAGLTNTYRLTNLAPDESAWLLSGPVAGLYTVPEETAATIHKATGGVPILVQLFGAALFRRWQDVPELNVMTVDDIKSVMPWMLNDAAPIFLDTWNRLSLVERLVLTAISGLLYDDPLRKIDTAAIEMWLVETDYPTDATTINAALRRLEFDEIVVFAPGEIALTAGLMQSWLMTNARLRPATAQPETRAESPQEKKRPMPLVAVFAIVLLVMIVVVLVAISNTPVESPDTPPAPTVTFAGGGG